LKEWVYLAGDGALVLVPIALLRSLSVSYITRSAAWRGYRLVA